MLERKVIGLEREANVNRELSECLWIVRKLSESEMEHTIQSTAESAATVSIFIVLR